LGRDQGSGLGIKCFEMSKSQPGSNLEFNAEELEVMIILEERKIIMDPKLRTDVEKKALWDYNKQLNHEYKETYAGLLRKKKNNKKELIVIKVLNEKNTIMESKPNSRTDIQKKKIAGL